MFTFRLFKNQKVLYSRTLLNRFVFLGAIFACNVVFAKGFSLPLWEAGIAGGYFITPDYPGADQQQHRTLFLPFLFYRGETLRSDRDGFLRGRLLNEATYEFDISLSGSFPVDSKNNRAREGMEGLDWLGQIGPKLVIHLTPKGSPLKIDFGLPVRYVVSTDFKRVDGRGFTTSPYFKMSKRNFFHPRLSARFNTEFTWASRPLMDYFYTVNPDDVTSDRPLYRADEGYLGHSTSLSFFWIQTRELLFFTSMSYKNYEGATNSDSPLFKSPANRTFILGLSWTLGKSDETEK